MSRGQQVFFFSKDSHHLFLWPNSHILTRCNESGRSFGHFWPQQGWVELLDFCSSVCGSVLTTLISDVSLSRIYFVGVTWSSVIWPIQNICFCWREGITSLNDSYKNMQLSLLVLFINYRQDTRINAFKFIVGKITLKVLSWPGRVDLVKCVGFSVLWLDRNLKYKGCCSTVNDGLIFSQLEKKTRIQSEQ